MLDESCTRQTSTANMKSEDTYLSLDAEETAPKATTREYLFFLVTGPLILIYILWT